MIPIPSTPPKPTGIEAKILFARFTERIKAWYEVPENKRRFEEWQAHRDVGATVETVNRHAQQNKGIV